MKLFSLFCYVLFSAALEFNNYERPNEKAFGIIVKSALGSMKQRYRDNKKKSAGPNILGARNDQPLGMGAK